MNFTHFSHWRNETIKARTELYASIVIYTHKTPLQNKSKAIHIDAAEMNKFRLGLSGTACVSIDLFGKFIIGLLSIGIAKRNWYETKILFELWFLSPEVTTFGDIYTTKNYLIYNILEKSKNHRIFIEYIFVCCYDAKIKPAWMKKQEVNRSKECCSATFACASPACVRDLEPSTMKRNPSAGRCRLCVSSFCGCVHCRNCV